MIRVQGVDHPICVDLQTTDNKIYNVVNDPVNREYFFRFSKSQVFISLYIKQSDKRTFSISFF